MGKSARANPLSLCLKLGRVYLDVFLSEAGARLPNHNLTLPQYLWVK